MKIDLLQEKGHAVYYVVYFEFDFEVKTKIKRLPTAEEYSTIYWVASRAIEHHFIWYDLRGIRVRPVRPMIVGFYFYVSVESEEDIVTWTNDTAVEIERVWNDIPNFTDQTIWSPRQVIATPVTSQSPAMT